MKIITKTDGKRSIGIGKIYSKDGVDLSFCRNGFQTTVVKVDRDMLPWLIDAVYEYLEIEPAEDCKR